MFFSSGVFVFRSVFVKKCRNCINDWFPWLCYLLGVLDVCDWYDPSGRSSSFHVPGPFVYYLLFVCCRGCMTGMVGCIRRYGYC